MSRLRPRRWAAAAAITSSFLAATTIGGALPSSAASDVRLNQMQVIGTHNSYHIEPPADLLATLIAIEPTAIELAYSHPPLPEQFSYEGVRQIELDVFADPAGDLWAPLGVPGYKVFHIEGIDPGTNCALLVTCLQQIKTWSDARPAHMPIAVLLEIKDSDDVPGPPSPIFVGPAEFDALDAELRSVFPEDRMITPDDIRGGHTTLEEAVLTDGWPKIDDVRQDVMFVLDNKRNEYADGHPSLEGRVAFTPSSPGQPDAAFIKENDPTGANTALIQGYVTAGYMVRTRADTPPIQAMANDTSMRDAALASGAQWVSTDYPVAGYSDRWGTNYVASIPGGNPARCNPVNGPEGCVSADIENLPVEVRPTTTLAPTTTTRPVIPLVNPTFTG